MDFRDAKIEDIKQMQLVRNSVKENKLSDPNLISEDDYKEFITKKGKGWVCEIKNQIVAFAARHSSTRPIIGNIILNGRLSAALSKATNC